LLNDRAIFLSSLNEKVAALENQQIITQNEWAAVDTEFQTARTFYNQKIVPQIGLYIENRNSSIQRVQQATATDFKTIDTAALENVQRSRDVRERINQLQFKIEGRSAA